MMVFISFGLLFVTLHRVLFKRMELGGRALSPEFWNTEQKWIITWTYEDVERKYSLAITQKGFL